MINLQNIRIFLTASSLAFIAAGLCTGAFWLSTLPFESFAGSEVTQHSLFIPGQVLHLVAAILTALGLCSIYLTTQLKNHIALLAFLLCLTGALAFLVDAAIALVTFPAIAVAAPELLEPNGAMFGGWVLGFYVGFSVLQMFGYISFGVVCWLSGKLPKDGCALLVIGGVIANLPPTPGMHWLLIIGGLLWSTGAVRLGMSALHQARQI